MWITKTWRVKFKITLLGNNIEDDYKLVLHVEYNGYQGENYWKYLNYRIKSHYLCSTKNQFGLNILYQYLALQEISLVSTFLLLWIAHICLVSGIFKDLHTFVKRRKQDVFQWQITLKGKKSKKLEKRELLQNIKMWPKI